MGTYIDRVNAYLAGMKVKQTYVSMKSGIDTRKLSRLLTGAQEITSTDMERIAAALGKTVEYFLSDQFQISETVNTDQGKVLFYVGEPTQKQEHTAATLVKLMENIDEVLSAKQRFLNIQE